MCDFVLFSVQNLPFSCVCVCFPIWLLSHLSRVTFVFFKQSVCCLFLQGTTGAPITDTHADVIRQCCDSQLLMEIKKVLVLCRTVGGVWRAGRDEEGVWGYGDHTQVSTV